jgi:hypothetical protein
MDPQIKAFKVTPLEGVSTSTVAPVDVAHTYGSPPYVDIAVRYVPRGFGIDERRFSHREQFRLINHNTPQSSQRTQSIQSLIEFLESNYINIRGS